MTSPGGSGDSLLESRLRDYELTQRRYLFSLLRLGARVQLAGGEKATVIILSYKRMENIRRILTSVLLCGFVDRVIVSNNNPDVDLSRYIPHQDPRIDLIQHKVHKGPSYRYDLARECDGEYFICIDDDVFPNPWQLRRMFMSLLQMPSRPFGCTGQVYDEHLRKWKMVKSRSLFPGNLTGQVDVILHIYVFTRKHLERYFEILGTIGVRNEDIHSSEDVIISFTGIRPPVFVDVGYMPQCSTQDDPAVATWQREDFLEYRGELYRKMCALRKG